MKKILFLPFVFLCLLVSAQSELGCKFCLPSPRTAPNGYVLTDSAGFARWQAVGGGGAGSFWKTTGNSGTDPSVNFIGTTDNQPLKFKVNNSPFLIADTSGNVSITKDRGGNITTGLEVSNDVLSLGILQGSYLIQSDPDSDIIAYTGVGLYTGTDDNTVWMATLNTATNDGATFRTTNNSIPGVGMEVTGQAYNGTKGATFSLNESSAGIGYSPDNDTTSFGFEAKDTYTGLSSYDGIGNPCYAMVEVNKFSFQKGNGGAQRYLLVDIAERKYCLGDIDSAYNGTRIIVNDSTSLVKVDGSLQINDGTQANGYVLTSDANGVCHFESPSRSDYSGIPAYANNAAALAVLGAGKLYYTDVAGEYILKVTH